MPVEGEMGESNVVPAEGEMCESNDKGEMGEWNDENDESQNIEENDDRVGSICVESTQSLHQENETETVCEGFGNDVDNEELLVGALTTASNLSSAISIEPSVSDVLEEKVVSDFMSKGCYCCSQKFSEEHILETRSHYASLTHAELDLIILGQRNPFTVISAYRRNK